MNAGHARSIAAVPRWRGNVSEPKSLHETQGPQFDMNHRFRQLYGD